ncbi:hypothetical protein [Oceaniserpentilla sp. 4NH20-0058]|uniref:hypothetical protein n=1 Tax=Oceaniserpentilla sp. 4NH20-0058 TaxID=3127660 RepID=UPI003340161F
MKHEQRGGWGYFPRKENRTGFDYPECESHDAQYHPNTALALSTLTYFDNQLSRHP